MTNATATREDALSQPEPAWEARLAVALLRSPMQGLVAEHRKAIASACEPRIKLNGIGTARFLNSRLTEIAHWGDRMTVLLNERFCAAFGEPGNPGDVRLIREACTEFLGMAKELVEWERAVASVYTPDPWRRVFEKVRGVSSIWMNAMVGVVDHLHGIQHYRDPSQVHRVVCVLPAPPRFSEDMTREIEMAIRLTVPLWHRRPALFNATGWLLFAFSLWILITLL